MTIEFAKYGDTGARFIEALRHFAIGEETLKILAHPQSIYRFSLPLRKDDGSLEIFQGMRVCYNTLLGPAKGGIRFHPDVTEAEMVSLGFRLTIKCAANSLPFGGSNGGIVVDPKSLSSGELERLSRGYVDAVYDLVGPDRDILSPDAGTSQRIMGWMSHQYNTIARRQVPTAVNGKPVALNGIVGRRTATAEGGLLALRKVLEARGESPGAQTVAIQGFGNVGSELALLLYEAGYRIVAISDTSAAVSCPKGLNIAELKHRKEQGQSLASAAADPLLAEDLLQIPHDSLFEFDADILIPAALGSQIRKNNAANIRARYVFELANGSTTTEAQAILDQKGIVLVPDIIANAGGVIVSAYEGAQNRQGEIWSEELVRAKMQRQMEISLDKMIALADEMKISFRVSAYVMAVQRLDAAISSLL